jgi:hypothetical protein
MSHFASKSSLKPAWVRRSSAASFALRFLLSALFGFDGMFSMKLTASLLLTILLGAVSVRAETGKATVKALDGSVSCMEGSQWKALKSGQKLSAGASVRTGPDGKADLDLEDNGPSLYLLDSTLYSCGGPNLQSSTTLFRPGHTRNGAANR